MVLSISPCAPPTYASTLSYTSALVHPHLNAGGRTTKGAFGIPLGLTSICLLLELEATVDIFPLVLMVDIGTRVDPSLSVLVSTLATTESNIVVSLSIDIYRQRAASKAI